MSSASRNVEFLLGGRLSLDLTWTVRFRSVRPTDLLDTPAALGEWLRLAGLPAPASPTRQHLASLTALREAIQRSVEATLDGGVMTDEDRSLLNAWAARSIPHPELRPGGIVQVVAPGREIHAAGSLVARDAIALLADASSGRLRRCEGPQCSLIFHDDSRPGTRRWCTTARCGNRVNTTAYRSRRREIASLGEGAVATSTD